MSDRLDEQTAARLGVLAEPKKHVTRVKGRPVEDFLFATLRCVDAERYGALTIMDTDPRWAFVQACADVLTRVLDQQDAHAARTAAEPGPGLLTVVVCCGASTRGRSASSTCHTRTASRR